MILNVKNCNERIIKLIKRSQEIAAELEKEKRDLINLEISVNEYNYKNPVPIMEKMKAAENIAEDRSRFNRKIEIKQDLHKKELEIEIQQGIIDNVRADKEKAIKESSMPIDGLEFGVDDVEFQTIPFTEISQAQKITISMSIAIAENPKLKVIRIMDGSLLDDESMIEIEKIAEKHDFQVFIERISPTKCGQTYFIEDGTIKK